jgi:hypothetical protein
MGQKLVCIMRLADDTRQTDEDESTPSAGPHATPELMNPDATPGAGTLPPIGNEEDGNVQPSS